MNEENLREDVDGLLDIPISNDNENLKELKEIPEMVAKGKIKNSLYWKYFRASGSYFLLIFVAILFIFTQFISSGSDYWLAHW